MRKREREKACGICGHYHKYEEGEICGVCGHRPPMPSGKSPVQDSAFPSEILPGFLYLGSYYNASLSGLLKTQGITRILNTVSPCQNLYRNSFSYHCLEDDKNLKFDDAIQFLEQCQKDKARVLVYCMSGKNRSPAFVIAYLMKCKGWRLPQSYQWVKDRRPSMELTEAVRQQLQRYERQIFGSSAGSNPFVPVSSSTGEPVMRFGFSKPNDPAPSPTFNSFGTTSIFARPLSDIPPQEFTFRGSQTQRTASGTPFSPPNPNSSDIAMDIS